MAVDVVIGPHLKVGAGAASCQLAILLQLRQKLLPIALVLIHINILLAQPLALLQLHGKQLLFKGQDGLWLRELRHFLGALAGAVLDDGGGVAGLIGIKLIHKLIVKVLPHQIVLLPKHLQALFVLGNVRFIATCPAWTGFANGLIWICVVLIEISVLLQPLTVLQHRLHKYLQGLNLNHIRAVLYV